MELAHDSPFIERVERTFTVEDTRLLRRAQSFLRRRSSALHSLSSRATALLQKQDADAVTIASAMLAPLLWHGLADPEEIREHFGFEVATVLKNLQTSDASDIDELSHRQENLQGIFSSMGKAPAVLCSSFLFASWRWKTSVNGRTSAFGAWPGRLFVSMFLSLTG